MLNLFLDIQLLKDLIKKYDISDVRFYLKKNFAIELHVNTCMREMLRDFSQLRFICI